MINKPVLWGALGGILPNIVQKAQELMSSTPDDSLEAIIYPTYVVGLVLLAIIGGVIVASFREQDSRKALFLGISAPALITVAASAPQQMPLKSSPPPKPVAEVVGSLLFNDAHAQDQKPLETLEAQVRGSILEADSNQVRQAVLQEQATVSDEEMVPNRFIEVFAVTGSESFAISFLDNQNKEVQVLDLPETRYGRIAVPAEASHVRFISGDDQSGVYQLSKTDAELQGYFVRCVGQRIYSFWSAFGRAPEVKYEFEITSELLQGYEAGQEGWSYAGEYAKGQWLKQYFTFTEGELPEVEGEYAVNYPVNVREEGDKNAKILGQLRLKQEVKVLEYVTQDDLNYWIRVRVLK